MPDAGTPPPRASELTVGPAEPLDAGPSATQDRLGFGRDPDRPGLLERLRGLPAVRAVTGRPWPRTVVAAVSALVSGVGVAVYLGGPPEEAPAAEPEPILRPESWLEVTEGIGFLPEPAELDPEQRALAEQELARHPADAPVVLALGDMGLGTAINGSDATLQGVPPGRYRLQATCVPPVEPSWPVRVVVSLVPTD